MSRPGCPEEQNKQKAESPDIVGGDEPIVYVLIQPVSANVHPTSGIPLAYFKNDRLKSGQLSVCRGLYSSYEELQQKVVRPQLSSDPSRKHAGYVWALCCEVRSIMAAPQNPDKEPTQRSDVGAFCVIDDGLTGFHAHARMGYCAPGADFWSKNDRTKARGDLSIVFDARGIHQSHAAPPFGWPKVQLAQRRRLERALRRATRKAARQLRRMSS